MWTDIVDKTAGFVARNGELTSWKFLFYLTQGNLKGESVVAAILPSHMEVR